MNAWVIGEVSEDRGPDKISNDTSTDPDHQQDNRGTLFDIVHGVQEACAQHCKDI